MCCGLTQVLTIQYTEIRVLSKTLVEKRRQIRLLYFKKHGCEIAVPMSIKFPFIV